MSKTIVLKNKEDKLLKCLCGSKETSPTIVDNKKYSQWGWHCDKCLTRFVYKKQK